MNKQLTILASRFYPDRHGGVETRLHAFAHSAAKLGVRTNVWSENRTNSAAFEQLDDNLVVRRRNRRHIARLSRIGPLMNVLWWRRWLRADRPEGFIWATDPAMAIAVVSAGLGPQLVYNPAGSCAAMCHIGRLHPAVKSMQLSPLWERLDRIAYRQAPRIVVSSQNVADQYEHFHGNNRLLSPFVVPLGVEQPTLHVSRDDSRRHWSIDRDAFVIGFVGRIDPCKQIDFALDALAMADLPMNARFLIVGEGTDEKRVREHAVDHGLTHRLIWTGKLDEPAKAYAAMDVCVLPSVYEAFGQVLLEAMTHGLPVIGRRGDGDTIMTASDEIISHGETGFVVDSFDPSDMAIKLELLARNRQQRQTMSAAAKQFTANLTWMRYAQECLQHLYTDSSWEHEVEQRDLQHAA